MLLEGLVGASSISLMCAVNVIYECLVGASSLVVSLSCVPLM